MNPTIPILKTSKTESNSEAVISREGFIIKTSTDFSDYLAIDETELQKINLFDLFHPDDKNNLIEILKGCVKKAGDSYELNLRSKSQKGKKQVASWRFELIAEQNKSNSFIRVIINQPKKDKEIKAEKAGDWDKNFYTNEIFKNILANSIDVILFTDETTKIIFSSLNVKEVLGYEPEDLIGQYGFSFVHPDDLEKCTQVFEDELKHPGKSKSVDLRFLKKDGSWLWAEAKGKNLFVNPHIQSMLINLNNISERKLAEESLFESEKSYRSFFENLSQPLLIINNNTFQIVDSNKAAVKQYGYSSEELKKLNFKDLFVEDISNLELKSLIDKKDLFVHKTIEGRHIAVQTDKFLVNYKNNQFSILVITDITESLRIQNDLKLAHQITAFMKRSGPIQKNLDDSLHAIIKNVNWDLVELWTPSYQFQFLKNESVAYDKQFKQIEEFITESNKQVYVIKDFGDLPTFKTMKPYWIEDLAADKNLVRRDLALKTGFQSVLTIPVINNGKLVCLLYLFSFQKLHQNTEAINLLSDVGHIIGAELELNSKDLVLDKFFNITTDIITIAGLNGKYIRVNPAFESFTGYNELEIPYIDAISLIYHDDKKAVLEQFTKLNNGETVNYFENRIVTRNGKVKWIAWSAVPILREGIVISTHRDITDQKEAAESMKMLNERYELVKEAASEAIWDYDLKTNKIFRSKGYQSMFGYDVTEAESFDFWQTKVHPDDKEMVTAKFQLLLKNPQLLKWECEYRFLRADGNYSFVSDKGFFIFDIHNQPIRMVGSMQDITRQREFAEKLKISNERYSLVTKATNEAIWDYNLITNKLTWSEGYKILFGHSYEDDESELKFWELNIHEDDKERVIKSFDTFLNQSENHFWGCEYRFKRKDESYAYVLDKGYLLFNDSKKPIRVVGAMQDISDRKQLEFELIQREKTKQNQIAMAAVNAQERERAEIGKELHDNVSQLLTTTKLYLEMMRHKQFDDLGELIDRGSKHINTVITEIRNLSRSLVPHSIDDLGLIASIADLIDNIKILGNTDIQFEYSTDIDTLLDDPIRLTLYRIVQEQMNNIVKHAKASNVTIELINENNFVLLTITDDGNGFDQDSIKSGMGLKNMKSRAELHNGTAIINTSHKNGCKLTVQIPLMN